MGVFGIVTNQFDSKAGGGFADAIGGATAKVTDATADFGADFVNTATGSAAGENAGWWGAFDKWFDPRDFSGSDATHTAVPGDSSGGLSGFLGGATQSTTALGSGLGALTTKPILSYLGLGGGSAPTGGAGSGSPARSGGLGIGTLAVIAAGLLAAGYALMGGDR